MYTKHKFVTTFIVTGMCEFVTTVAIIDLDQFVNMGHPESWAADI